VGDPPGFDAYGENPLAQETLEAEDYYWSRINPKTWPPGFQSLGRWIQQRVAELCWPIEGAGGEVSCDLRITMTIYAPAKMRTRRGLLISLRTLIALALYFSRKRQVC